MTMDLYLALVMRLATGVFAIQASDRPVDWEHATGYAMAAIYHGTRAGVDPYELIGIARNESEFVENRRGPDGKDCGIAQTRTTISKFTCRQLLNSYWLSFAEAAREMREYADSCHKRVSAAEYDRCRINYYNSGVHYAKSGVHGAYWLRVGCFAEAARNAVPIGASCRHVHSKRDIARLLEKRRSLLTLEVPAASASVLAAIPVSQE